jgi:2'-5' RNA ligase
MARPLSGASEISEAQHEDWRRGSTMPRVLADGEVAGGLNSGEDAGAWRSWGGTIAAEQKLKLTRWVNWQLGLIFASKDGPTRGRVPETWEVEWTPIAEPDAELEARVGELEAKTDKVYVDIGVLRDRDVRQHRAVDGKAGRVRVESSDLLPEPSAEDIEAEAAAQAGSPTGKDVQRQALIDRHEHEKAAVVVVLPDAIARRFPYRPEESLPPHCTVLFVGPTPWDQIETVREAVAQLSAGLLPLRARLGDLGFFDRPDGGRVAWVAVEFEPSLDVLHDELRAELMTRGVMVQHPDRPWTAHATLAYLAAGEDYDGPVPAAGLEWTVERLEVWHGEG